MWTLFSFRGRIERGQFLERLAVISILAVVLILIMNTIYGERPNNFQSMSIFAVIVVWLYLGFSLLVKRMHDANTSGWYSLLVFLPTVSTLLIGANSRLSVVFGIFTLIILSTLLLFFALWPGTKGPNTYGEEPGTY
jgi:uncharacterized membrane protein YhaH (DUF805 family)